MGAARKNETNALLVAVDDVGHARQHAMTPIKNPRTTAGPLRGVLSKIFIAYAQQATCDDRKHGCRDGSGLARLRAALYQRPVPHAPFLVRYWQRRPIRL